MKKQANVLQVVAVAVPVAFAAGVLVSQLRQKGQKASLDTGGCKPSHPPNFFEVSADTIQAAVYDLGTDEAAIFRTFDELNSDCDFAALFNAYGIRKYFSFSTLWVNLNLTQTLQADLTNSELVELNELLKARGITYRV